MKLSYALALLGASANAIRTTKTSFADLGQYTNPTLEYPGDNCCYLYQHRGYRGLREQVCHEGEKRGFYITEETGDAYWNDRMSSYYCGRNVWYNMCRHGPGNCTGENLNSGAGHHRNPDLRGTNNGEGTDFDDTMTYMEMGPYDPSEVGAINLFRFGHCHGRVTRAYYNPEDPVGGRYNGEDLEALGMITNDITSLMLPKGYWVHLYDDADLWNYMDWFEGRYKNDFTQELECRNLGDNDNKLGSLEIHRDNNLIGQWQAITSTESQVYKFHVGINTKQSERSASEIQETLTKGAELGFVFKKMFTGGASVNHELSETLKTDMQSTYGVDYGIENTTNCTTEGKEGAGMYQWVVGTRDAKYQTFTWHTVCRTGADFNIPPECPYGACLDAECKECKEDWDLM